MSAVSLSEMSPLWDKTLWKLIRMFKDLISSVLRLIPNLRPKSYSALQREAKYGLTQIYTRTVKVSCPIYLSTFQTPTLNENEERKKKTYGANN